MALSFIVAPPAAAASVETAGELPSARLGSGGVHVGDGVIYAFGGRISRTHLVDEIVKFDTKTGLSEPIGKIPPARPDAEPGLYAHATVYDGERIWLLGGAALVGMDLNADGQKELVPQSVDSIFVFDPKTEKITKLSEKLPSSRWGLAGAYLGGKIYLFGGWTFDLLNSGGELPDQHSTVMRFDPATRATTTLKNELPFKVADQTTVVHGGRIWLIGGLGEDTAEHDCGYVESGGAVTERNLCNSRAILKFDAANEFARFSPAKLPEGLQFHATALVGDSAYVFGGQLQTKHGSSKIHRIDLRADKVETLTPTLPGGRWGFPAVPVGEDVYLIGGRDGEAFQDGMDSILRFRASATAPWAPRDLTAAVLGDAEAVSLSWQPPIYDGDAAITAYRVYRLDAAGASERLGDVPGTLTFKDPAVEPGKEYTYRVVAVNKVGESLVAAEKTVTVGPRPPDAPRGFQVFGGDSQVILRWAPPASDGGEAIKHYRVYRSGWSSPKLFTLGDLSTAFNGGFYTWVDDSVVNNETYAYKISADNAKGEGARTLEVRVTPLPVPAAPGNVQVTEEGATVRVTWEAPGGSTSGYNLYKGTEPYKLARVNGDAPLTETSFVDAEVTRGLTYHYAIAAVNSHGEGAWSELESIPLFDPPGPPRNLITKEEPGRVTLQWIPPEDTGGADALTYLVLRQGPDGQKRVIASELAATNFADRLVQPGAEYTYWIKAYNGILGDESTPKTATPKEIQRVPPVAAVTAVGGTHVDPDVEVVFDASLSTDADGRVVKWVFDFGDGTPPLETQSPTVAHTYTAEKTFTVRVTAVDDMGLQSDAPATLTIDVGAAGREGIREDPLGGELPTDGGDGDPGVQGDRPGTKTPGKPIPAPGLALAAVALAGVAMLVARKRG